MQLADSRMYGSQAEQQREKVTFVGRQKETNFSVCEYKGRVDGPMMIARIHDCRGQWLLHVAGDRDRILTGGGRFGSWLIASLARRDKNGRVGAVSATT